MSHSTLREKYDLYVVCCRMYQCKDTDWPRLLYAFNRDLFVLHEIYFHHNFFSLSQLLIKNYNIVVDKVIKWSQRHHITCCNCCIAHVIRSVLNLLTHFTFKNAACEENVWLIKIERVTENHQYWVADCFMKLKYF